jgi:prepilin-type N-terminal cleavage/methylation domain-containing protein
MIKNRTIIARRQRSARGFTIMELLVATMVFSVVLLLVTAGILQITRVYYKGVTESNTQNTARSIIDTVSQAIQFSGGAVTPTSGSPVPGTDYAFCVGNQQFSYRLGWQVEDRLDPTVNQTWHALVQNSAAGCSGSTAPQSMASQTVNGRDLMGPHMRLSKLSVASLGANLYEIRVKVVYGDNDLLNNPTTSTASCKGVQAGTQFCSVSELSTIVVKRVE